MKLQPRFPTVQDIIDGKATAVDEVAILCRRATPIGLATVVVYDASTFQWERLIPAATVVGALWVEETP